MKPRLCLHFDINKTIIMTDASSGRSVHQTLNSLLSECTWGLCELKSMEERSHRDWVVCCSEPCFEPPVPGAMTLGSYLEDHTTVPKTEQTQIKRAFTDMGSIGEQFRVYRDKLDDALRLPDDVDIPSDLSVLSTGYYHIVPSFFQVIEYLVESGIEFNLLFRTFGVDIEHVCEEFNLFCEGRHPIFKPRRKLDGTDPTFGKDLRIALPYFHGRLSHTDGTAGGLHMTYTLPSKEVTKVSGAEAVFRTIMQDWFGINQLAAASTTGPAETADAPTARTHSAAIQDDFNWWHIVNDESETSGKLLLVDTDTDADASSPGQSGQQQVIQVFFDDNIERDRAHIVDVRDRRTYAPVPFAVAKGRYLRRVEPFRAIMEPDYFIKEVQDVLKMHGH